ncbi:MCE family protein [Amycolatopsis suaedae]|uniref:MCE family protein n=1 Tax=Amycolatopsis suaedae TaxID=2510978 RepID=UPI0013EF48F0|nr:MCE family protein [Amycolatopsis suaedae]
MNWTPKRPLWTGLLGIGAVLGLLAVAVLAPRAYFTATTADYHAHVANASGLRADDPVHVAGVPAGRVTSVTLAGDRVDVAFRLDRDVTLGDRSEAAVKLLTVLGRRYLEVRPAGQGSLETIPLERTRVPYLLDDLGRDAQQTTGQLDLNRIRQMLRTLAEVTPDDPAQLRRALDGAGAVATVVSENDAELGRLLTGAQQVTQLLIGQSDRLVTLLGNADLVLRTLTDRKEVIATLLTDVDRLTATAAALLRENRPRLDTVLGQLRTITQSLHARQGELAATITRLAPVSRYLANATGNGTWGDVASPGGPIPDNLLCVVGLARGCR